MISSFTSSSHQSFHRRIHGTTSSHFADSLRYLKQKQFVREFPLDVHPLRWEIVWRNTPRIWRDFWSALPFQARLTQTKPVLPLSNEHGSQVKDQGRRNCCHNKHKMFPYRPTRDVSLLSGRASYFSTFWVGKVACSMCVHIWTTWRYQINVEGTWHHFT
jgi:hypothetical protein